MVVDCDDHGEIYSVMKTAVAGCTVTRTLVKSDTVVANTD